MKNLLNLQHFLLEKIRKIAYSTKNIRHRVLSNSLM